MDLKTTETVVLISIFDGLPSVLDLLSIIICWKGYWPSGMEDGMEVSIGAVIVVVEVDLMVEVGAFTIIRR